MRAVSRPTALALSSSAWETALVTAMSAQSQTWGPIRRCVDIVDLLADAGAGTIAVACVDASFPRLSAAAVARLLTCPVLLVGLSGDEAGADQLSKLGVRDIVLVDPAQIDRTLEQVVSYLASAELAVKQSSAIGATPADLPTGRSLGPVEPATTRSRGSLVAVWGPSGAPGRTSVAIAIAEAAGGQPGGSLLVDFDTRAPGVADALAIEQDTSGLIAACRAADQGMLTTESLARAARCVNGQFRVLTGLPHPSRWPELRPSAISGLLVAGRLLSSTVVVDVGSSCEQDNDLAAPSHSIGSVAGRDLAALAALAQADVVVAVIGCQPIALARFMSSVGRVRDAADGAPLQVVVNAVRETALGAGGIPELVEFVERESGAQVVTVVPSDQPAFDRAALAGLTIGEYRAQSLAARALAEVADLATAMATHHVAAATELETLLLAADLSK